MAATADRTLQTQRRVRPGRLAPSESPNGGLHHEQYATAVVGPDGEALFEEVFVQMMTEQMSELRRIRLALELLVGEEVPDPGA